MSLSEQRKSHLRNGDKSKLKALRTPLIRGIFDKLDIKGVGYLTNENLGISNLNGEEMKYIQNFLYVLLNQTEIKQYFFEDFQRACRSPY